VAARRPVRDHLGVGDGKRTPPGNETTVVDLPPVASGPRDTLDAPSDPAMPAVVITAPVLEPVPEPARTLDLPDETTGKHRQPAPAPARLDVVAAAPRKPVVRRAPVGSDAFESAAPSDPSRESMPAAAPPSPEGAPPWLWLALLVLGLAAVALAVAVALL
jgi:hypothetical protein